MIIVHYNLLENLTPTYVIAARICAFETAPAGITITFILTIVDIHKNPNMIRVIIIRLSILFGVRRSHFAQIMRFVGEFM